MNNETPKEAYERGREEVFELLTDEKLRPRNGMDREEWGMLIDGLVSMMKSNDHVP